MTDAVSKILQLSIGYWPSRVLHVVAESGVADVLGDEPRAAAEMAGKVASIHWRCTDCACTRQSRHFRTAGWPLLAQ